MSQGNPLYRYLKQTKVSVFYKIGKQEGQNRLVPVRVGERMWELVKEGEYGANTVYTCM
jgi:hypothetical protein